VFIGRDAEIEWLAADRAVFNIFLITQRTVYQQLDLLAASGAVYSDSFQNIHLPVITKTSGPSSMAGDGLY